MRFSAASSAWLGALCLALAPAHAMAAPVVAARVVLPAMPLGDALLALARQTGRNILFATSDVAGAQAPAIRARDFDHALQILARSNGLVATRLAGGAVRLRRPQFPAPRVRPAVPRRMVAPPVPPTIEDRTAIVVEASLAARAWTAGDAVRPQDALASTQIRRLPDRTIAEALGRLPGIVTLATSLEGAMGRVDHAGRATGDFVAMRGLPGTYVETRIDGFEIPQSLPYSRGTQLGLMALAPDMALQVHRVLDARLAGEAIAGTLDIDHLAPFAAKARGLRLGLTAGADDQAWRFGQNAGTWGANAGFGWQTPDGRLALTASAALSRRHFASVEQTYQSGNLAYALTDAQGQSAPGLDPAANLLLASVNAQVTRGTAHEETAFVALGWRADDRLTVTASAMWASRAIAQDVYQVSVQGGRAAGFFAQTATSAGLLQTQSVRADAHYWFETNPERDRLGMAQLALAWNAGRVQAQARVFGALGRTDRPDHIEISFWDSDATRLSGGVRTAYVRGFPVLRLDPGDAALVANPLAFPVHNQGERESETSQDHRLGGDWRVRLADDAAWHGEIGGLAVLSWRSRATAHFLYADTLPAGTTLGNSGLVDGQIGPVLRGIYDYTIPTISDAALLRAIGRAKVQPRTIDDSNANAYAVQEDRLAAYVVVGRPLADGLDAALGLRGEWSHIGGRYWLAGNDGVPADGVAYGWNRLAARYAALLPSVTLHWRSAGPWTADAALWTSMTRPSPFQLTGGGSATRDNQGVTEIQVSNPDLKAVRGTNLDLGLAWQGPGGLHLALGAFAKRLARYLNDTGNDLNNPASVMQYRAVRLIRPENGGTATILGAEASVALPLGLVAGALRHFALAGDLTLLHSAVHLENPALDRVERTQYAPASNLLLRLHYDDGRFSADAACRLTGAYIQEYGIEVPSFAGTSPLSGSALDTWVRPSRQIDFAMARSWGTQTLRLALRNGLGDTAYRATIGRYSDAVPQTILGGRQLLLTWSAGF